MRNVSAITESQDVVDKAYVDSSIPDITPSSLIAEPEISNSLQEWWIYPVATYVKEENRTLIGGYADNGKILVSEVNHLTGVINRVEAATTTIIDDHNNPAVMALAGRRTLIAYTNHNTDTIMRFKVSDADGNINSLATNAEQTYNVGENVSYAQIHHIAADSTATVDAYWLFSRISNDTFTWKMLRLTVNHTTGVVSVTAQVPIFTSTAQEYLSTAPSHDGKIRIAVGHNPASLQNRIFYLEVNIATGDVTSPMDANAVQGNVRTNTGLPVLRTEITPVIDQPVDPENVGVRLFYVRPGPSLPAISYATWNKAEPDLATYWIARATSSAASTWANKSYGIAGPRIGYTDTSNYISGMAFPDPALDDSFVIARKSGTTATIQMYTESGTATSYTTAYTSNNGNFASRPIVPVNGGPITAMFSDVSDYQGFADYDSTVKLLTATAPVVSVPNAALPQTGWGYVVGPSTAPEVTAIITFQTPFAAPPNVLVTFAGENATSGTLIEQFTTSSRLVSASGYFISATGFRVSVRRTDSSNFPTGSRRFAYTWAAYPSI